MRSAWKSAAVVALGLSLASFAYGATVSGTVKGPDGKPLKGAFVEAQGYGFKGGDNRPFRQRRALSHRKSG